MMSGEFSRCLPRAFCMRAAANFCCAPPQANLSFFARPAACELCQRPVICCSLHFLFSALAWPPTRGRRLFSCYSFYFTCERICFRFRLDQTTRARQEKSVVSEKTTKKKTIAAIGADCQDFGPPFAFFRPDDRRNDVVVVVGRSTTFRDASFEVARSKQPADCYFRQHASCHARGRRSLSYDQSRLRKSCRRDERRTEKRAAGLTRKRARRSQPAT